MGVVRGPLQSWEGRCLAGGGWEVKARGLTLPAEESRLLFRRPSGRGSVLCCGPLLRWVRSPGEPVLGASSLGALCSLPSRVLPAAA